TDTARRSAAQLYWRASTNRGIEPDHRTALRIKNHTSRIDPGRSAGKPGAPGRPAGRRRDREPRGRTGRGRGRTPPAAGRRTDRRGCSADGAARLTPAGIQIGSGDAANLIGRRVEGTDESSLPYIADMRLRVVLTLLLALPFIFSPAGFASDLVLVHAKIYPAPNEQPIEDGTIVIHNRHIVSIGPGTQTKAPRFARSVTVVDCQGRTVTAGFWNSHVHILTPGLLHAENIPSAKISSQLDERLTRWGFTTVFDIASVLSNTNNIRRRIEKGEVRGPRILTV